VFGTYRDVYSVPGSLRFSAAGLLARLPMSMLGIGIVLLVQATYGSYGTAGSVAGVFGLTNAVAAPWIARLVDRFGQARVMVPGIGMHLIGLVVLIVGAQLKAAPALIYASAVVAAGTTGTLGSLVRARWSYVLAGSEREQARLHTAYSLESVLDEVVYIVGPVLVTVLATSVWPPAGLIAAAVAVGVGGLLFVLQRGTEPPPSPGRPDSEPKGRGLLRGPGFLVLLPTMVCAGSIFGSMEVVTVAFTDEQGRIGLSGAVLAVWAFGSLLAGLLYGTVQWTIPPGRRFLLAVLVLAAGISPVLLAGSVAQLAMLIALGGFAISPTIIAGNALVQDLVPPQRLTEGLTWVISAIGIGMSGGAALAGAAVDRMGAQEAYLVPVSSGLLAAVIVLVGSRALVRSAPVAPAGVSEASAAPR
jgi:MFS family permease